MLHGGGMPVHVPGEGWAKRAGKMPHGAVISLSIEEEGPPAGWPSGRMPGRIRQ